MNDFFFLCMFLSWEEREGMRSFVMMILLNGEMKLCEYTRFHAD